MVGLAFALALVAADPPTLAEPGPATQAAEADLKKADWAYLPSAEDMLRVYPKAARKARIPGKAIVACTVTVTGRLDACSVVEESGEGFGQAALDFTETLRMKPATRGGVAVVDSIRIPLVWNPQP